MFSNVHVNLVALYPVVLNVALTYAAYWVLPKVIRLFKS